LLLDASSDHVPTSAMVGARGAITQRRCSEEHEMTNNNHRVTIRIGLIAAVMLGAACLATAQDVAYNAMPGTDFSKFKTYKWVTIQGAAHPDQIVEAQIKQAIDAQLAAKKLTLTTVDAADLYVGYQVAVTQQKQWTAYGGGLRWGGVSSATSNTINIGTLDIDFYDQAGKQLVWRGSATKTLDDNPKPQTRQKNIDKAVDKLLKNFMPPAKK
jgi:hypothetical protein